MAIIEVTKVTTFFTVFGIQGRYHFLASMNWANLTQLLTKTDVQWMSAHSSKETHTTNLFCLDALLLGTGFLTLSS